MSEDCTIDEMTNEEEVAEEEEQLSPEEIDFSQRVHENILREMDHSYEDVLREYRRIEEEFVARVGDNEEVALDFKRRISKQILGAACRTDQPHEVCRGIWEELLQRGFADLYTKQIHVGIYARCCQFNGEFAAGIGAIDAVITETETELALEGTALTPHWRHWYGKSIEGLRKIRDELVAGIRK